jgi:hypothetical protein
MFVFRWMVSNSCLVDGVAARTVNEFPACSARRTAARSAFAPAAPKKVTPARSQHTRGCPDTALISVARSSGAVSASMSPSTSTTISASADSRVPSAGSRRREIATMTASSDLSVAAHTPGDAALSPIVELRCAARTSAAELETTNPEPNTTSPSRRYVSGTRLDPGRPQQVPALRLANRTRSGGPSLAGRVPAHGVSDPLQRGANRGAVISGVRSGLVVRHLALRTVR